MAQDQEPSSQDHGQPGLRDAETVMALSCDLFLGPQGPMPMTGVTHLTLDGVDADLLRHLRPTLVITPLFTADHDATATIERLVALGYTGRVTILAPKLPNPRLVERELASLGLAVTLISP
jgi:hypothetical protein